MWSRQCLSRLRVAVNKSHIYWPKHCCVADWGTTWACSVTAYIPSSVCVVCTLLVRVFITELINVIHCCSPVNNDVYPCTHTHGGCYEWVCGCMCECVCVVCECVCVPMQNHDKLRPVSKDWVLNQLQRFQATNQQNVAKLSQQVVTILALFLFCFKHWLYVVYVL